RRGAPHAGCRQEDVTIRTYMAKASKQSSPRKSGGRSAPARQRAVTAARSSKRGTAPAQPVCAARAVARKKDDHRAVTRVTHETEVRGTETRVERDIERAPKPSLPDVDRAAG